MKRFSPVSSTPRDTGLDAARVRAITLDLDDTLWPIWPTIERAEAALLAWLAEHAPATAAWSANPGALRGVRNHMQMARPDLAHDLSALRRESIRMALRCGGDDPALAEPAFDVFFEERQRVDLYDDALPVLAWLSERFPVVALSNGNADVNRVGLGQHFRASISAKAFGVGKPDPRIFHAAAEAAGVEAGDVLHVGDDPHLDGVGALQAGMQLAWLNRDDKAWEHAPLQPHLTVRDLMALREALS
jgi:HAD superfamily hydrolase (TIGR01549 family)